MATSYKVNVWAIQQRYRAGDTERKKPSRYVVRWAVDGERFEESYKTSAAADSFRSDLMSAHRKGEAFDTDNGRPVVWDQAETQAAKPKVSVFELARAYSASRWDELSPGSRRNMAADLTDITIALLGGHVGRPERTMLRRALRSAFNASKWEAGIPEAEARVIDWVKHCCRDVAELADETVMRNALATLGKKADGSKAAPDTIRLRRTTFKSMLTYGVVNVNLLEANPMNDMKGRKGTANIRKVETRSVPNPVQSRTLLMAVHDINPRFEAFFGTMYHAGTRPEEAVNIAVANLELPKSGWGVIHLEGARPEVAGEWTDSGEDHEVQPLKHRGDGETRSVPCNPELTELLHSHIARFGTAPDGRLFRGVRRGTRLGSSVYGRVWALARANAFTPEVAEGPLARRPYDLRHAWVSTLLTAGVEPTRVAQWAGHSLRVLMEVYATFLDAGEREAQRRIERLLGIGGAGQQGGTVGQ